MDTVSTVLSWFKARLAEPSTWAGIAAGASAISTALSSKAGLAAAVAAALVAIVKAESAKPSA